MYQATISSPIGKIGIRSTSEHLLGIDYLSSNEPLIKPKTIVAKETVEQILCYFADPEFSFDIPFNLNVTPFQKTVLQALLKIPVGETRSYLRLANLLETKPRLVGNACRKNPIPIIIPCHRIVATTGIGGYSGALKGPLIEIKRWLLQHEGVRSPYLKVVVS